MIGTAKTHIQWLKMINIKNCSKIINNKCPCADRLRKITLKIPINEEEIKLERELYKQNKLYKMCFNNIIKSQDFDHIE
jgi:hypothetical protein